MWPLFLLVINKDSLPTFRLVNNSAPVQIGADLYSPGMFRVTAASGTGASVSFRNVHGEALYALFYGRQVGDRNTVELWHGERLAEGSLDLKYPPRLICSGAMDSVRRSDVLSFVIKPDYQFRTSPKRIALSSYGVDPGREIVINTTRVFLESPR